MAILKQKKQQGVLVYSFVKTKPHGSLLDVAADGSPSTTVSCALFYGHNA